MALEQLLSPIRLRSLELRNRVVMGPHGSLLAENGLPTDQLTAYYEARARGGAALLCPSTFAVQPRVAPPAGRGFLSIWHPDAVSAHGKMLDQIRQHGARMFGQIGHGGRQVSGEAILRPVPAPSPIPYRPGGEMPREMTKRDIDGLIESFGVAAEKVKEIGYDGVEIHAANGYLLHQFLSPLSNARTDEYGGSLENRLRVPMSAVEAVRNAVGNDYPVGIRISGVEFVEGGMGLEDQVRVAEALTKSGFVDYLSVSPGAYKSMERVVPPMYFEQGVHASITKAIRDAANGVPVMVSGRIFEAEFADQLIADGIADLAVMTRALIADPDLVEKASSSSIESTRKCVGINDCWKRFHDKRLPISCALNPETGRELEYRNAIPTSDPKRVLVVGGGPAGLEAALRLKRKGHDVTVFESEDHIGGQVGIAAAAHGRSSLGEIIRFFQYQIEETGLDVRLNTVGTPENLTAENPDVVVLSLGSRPAHRSGLPENNAFDVRSALKSPDALGRQVVLYTETRGLHGLSVADTLSRSGKEVLLVTPNEYIGSELDPSTYSLIRHRLSETQVRTLTDLAFIRMADGVVQFKDVWGQHIQEYPADSLVYDFGDEPNRELADGLQGRVAKIYQIGDCLTPRGLQAAFWDAAGLAQRV